MIRITADIDNKNRLVLLKYIAKAIFKIKDIISLEVKRSNSKGYHMIIYTDKFYNQSEQYKLRAFIGDDPSRIRLDKRRKIGKNTLFEYKIYVNKNIKNENKYSGS
jgi:hypothetical protein